MLWSITKVLIWIAIFIAFITSIQAIFYVLWFIYWIVFNLFYLFTYVWWSCDVAVNCTRLLLTWILFFLVIYFYRKLSSSWD